MLVAVLASRSLAERLGPPRRGVVEVEVERRAVRWRGDPSAAAEFAEYLAMAEYRQATNGDIANMAGSVRVVCALDECEQLGQYIVECMPMLVMEYTDGRRQCRLVPSFEVEVDHSLGAVEVTGYLPLLGDLFHCLVHERGMR